jgi:tRNA (cytidine/uridine-2'-O-)-methyltransferase
VPDEVASSADERLLIPIRPDMRSLNVAMAAAMAAGEALRQTRAEPFSDDLTGEA